VRRFSVMMLALATAATIAAPFSATAQPDCGIIPDEVCDELPSTGCPYFFPDAVCDQWPGQPSAPGDQQIMALPTNQWNPAQVQVRFGGGLIFHNMSTAVHTITHDACIDGDAGTQCLFNVALERAQRLDDAKRIPITSAFSIDAQYTYVCTRPNMEGMTGTFTVIPR